MTRPSNGPQASDGLIPCPPFASAAIPEALFL
jgi:hypothetical protein